MKLEKEFLVLRQKPRNKCYQTKLRMNKVLITRGEDRMLLSGNWPCLT